jgi:hypothetical protein
VSNTATELPALSDQLLAERLRAAGAQGDVLVVANGFTAVAGKRTTSAGPWMPVGRGDFGLNCGAVAEVLATEGRLWWANVNSSPASTDLGTVAVLPPKASSVRKWLKDAQALTTTQGRGASPKADDMDELGYLAAWRCQFAGCGKDLRRHAATGAPNRSSYFAHIIASSPNGPRGDALLSDQLSADIENFLLLCDDCHRRIDRQDPDRFTVDVLRRMRRQSIADVRRLLTALQYAEALPVVVMGNIAGQSPHFDAREAEEAMWTRKRRMTVGHPVAFFENGWNQHNPHSAGYWSALFNGVQAEIPQLRKLLRSPAAGDSSTPLAVFPLHGTSVLVLAGRVFGEATATTVFQFRRDRSRDAEGGRWGYDAQAVPASPSKYSLAELRVPQASEQEAALIVALTFDPAVERFPRAVQSGGAVSIPALKLSASGSLGPDILQSPVDLDEVSQLLGEAVRKLQDDWRMKTVHLFVAAPASVAFKMGQKLQARHQSAFVCYEAERGPQAPFSPTIELRSTEALVPGTVTRLQLD